MMKRLLSYILPITKKIPSEHNGTLELTWYNGKQLLDTKNTNYSYGSLQKILKVGLDHLDVSKCNHILILGLGGGSVVQTLRNDFKYPRQITAVEIDPVVTSIAQNEFNLSKDKNLKIHCCDASHFIVNSAETYDLIIVDLFIDDEVPSIFMTIPFWTDLLKLCPINSQILFNASMIEENQFEIKSIEDLFTQKGFKTDLLFKVNGTNTLFLAKRNIS